MLYRLIVWGVMALVLSACDEQPYCEAGEFRIRGKLPPRLFAFETACREDCFTSSADSACSLDCGEMAVSEMNGALWGIADEDDVVTQIVDDRMLTLVDTGSLSDGRAIVWEFGYVDMANGQAPVGWGFMKAGPRTYKAQQWDSTAQFVARVGVAIDLNSDGIYSLNPLDGEVAAAGSQVLESFPAQIEILETVAASESGDGQLNGRFFLAFDTPTKQPQSELLGCFNLSVAPSKNDGEYRREVYP